MESLKILQLNVWGGRIRDGLSRFIAEGDYDVVCMQEAVWDENKTGFLEEFVDTVDKIKSIANFKYDFRSSNYGISILNGEVRYELGNAILSKIPFQTTEEKVIIGEYGYATHLSECQEAINNHRYTAQKVVLENGLAIVNYHGYWLKDPLGDEVSTKCMRSVADMMRSGSSPAIMCGDLNVISEAPCMRELDFLTDLTAMNDIKTTLRNIRFVKDVACDHILVNEKVSYQNFKVIDAPVSDHRGLFVEVKF